jgi:CCR4-NOT transcription complex subunit 1
MASEIVTSPATDGGPGIVNILMDLGPACTSNAGTFRDALRLITQKLPGGSSSSSTGLSSGAAIPLKEGGIARLIHFFAAVGARSKDTSNNNNSTASDASLSSAFVGVLMNDTTDWNKADKTSPSDWNLDVVSQVLTDFSLSLHWPLVARSFDFPEFKVRDVRHVELLLALYNKASGKHQLPLDMIVGSDWRNKEGQLTLLRALLIVPPSVYKFPLEENEEEVKDAASAALFLDGTTTPNSGGLPPVPPSSCPNPGGFACSRVLQRLLSLSDEPKNHHLSREVMGMGLQSCPEIILCALVRLQLSNASAININDNTPAQLAIRARANAGMPLKGELMRELIPLFFSPNPKFGVKNPAGAIRRLWEISPNTVVAACVEAFKCLQPVATEERRDTVVHQCKLLRKSLPNADNGALQQVVNGSKDADFAFTLACHMADNNLLDFPIWLSERMNTVGKASIALQTIVFLSRTYNQAKLRSTVTAAGGGGNGDNTISLVLSWENLATMLRLLVTFDSETLSQVIPNTDTTLGSQGKIIMERCMQLYPNIATLTAYSSSSSNNNNNNSNSPGGGGGGGGGNNQPDEIEEAANAYFQKIYASEESAREVVEMLKRFKTSGSSRENDIFACMIHNLFDEYRFFSKYPEKELRITGILFGLLIKEQLVSSITLGIALRYVLEALRKPPNQSPQSGKMFRFGMFALEQFKERLHEWPQYCSHIVQIGHLREGYAALVGEIETAMDDNQSAGSISTGPTAPTGASGITESSAGSVLGGEISVPSSSMGGFVGSTSGGSVGSSAPLGGLGKIDLPPPKPKKAVFGPGLGRAVNAPAEQNETQNEAPPDQILDRVQFLINNLSISNCAEKANDLRDILERRYFPWLGNYLVVKRISTQPNFHTMYLCFIDSLGEYGKGLVDAIIASVYVNVGKLLRSQKITTSTSERSLLKNLGSWLGQITLARNRPILQIMLDCKELLFQGYETGMLIAVTPFVAKILEGAKNSTVFRPPNPWLMGLMGVFRALYNVDDLKMNIKFEVEVLCKNLNLKLEDIPLRNTDLSKRIPPVKEKNPDFNLKSQSAATTPAPAMSPDKHSSGASTGGDSTKSDDEPQQTVIPNLAAYVQVNPNLTQLFEQVQGGPLSTHITLDLLKRSVPIAVDNAIREIIQPVVERSVSIACITSKAIVTKDFAMEGDENKMQKAAQLMVANLAGSLALVTCREPLHSSISTHLRQILSNAINDATGNPSTSTQLGELEKNALDQCCAICSTDNLELGCRLIEKAATEKAVRKLNDTIAPALTLRKETREKKGQLYYDMSIFGNENQRYPRELPDMLRPKPGGLRPEQLLVYDAFQRIPRQPGPTQSSSESQSGQSTGDASNNSSGQLNLNAISAIAIKLDKTVETLLNTAGPRAQEISLAMIPPEHDIKQLIAAIPRVVASAGDPSSLSSTDTDSILSFSQGILKRIYEVDLSQRLRLEALIALLEMLNKICPQLGRNIGTWTKYAPTKSDSERKLHRAVLLLLVRSDLIQIGDLDAHLAKSADEGRDQIWLEFLILFVRAATLENIVPPAKMPNMINIVQLIAEDSAPSSQQINPAFRKAAARLLEELRNSISSGGDARVGVGRMTPPAPRPSYEESSSMSPTSVKQLTDASLVIAKSSLSLASNDPPNARQNATDILVNWLRVQNEAAGNDKILAQFLQLLQQKFGVGSSDDETERFLRLTSEVVVESCVKSADANKGLRYDAIDGYAKLLSYLVIHMNGGGTAEQVAQQRLTMLNKVLGAITRSLVTSHEKAQQTNTQWDQRPWFRLLLDLVCELNTPNQMLDAMKSSIVNVFGSAFHVIQPLVVPGFAFAWLELISHRMFLSNLLLARDQKGWGVMHQLLIDLFLFMEPHLRKLELTDALKKYYDGTLRVILMLVHDFPTFLAAYHLSFCNVIPENCVQLRNIILSATPKGVPFHDPINRNFKIDQLPEIAQSPLILSNVVGPLMSFKNELDNYLRGQQSPDFLNILVSQLRKEDNPKELDAPKVNSIVLYVGIQGLARLQNDQISSNLRRTPEMELFQKLMELDDHGRYIILNAFANQLRYPSSHTHYFSCVMLFLFNESKDEGVLEQITRVLLERLITQRPHPWGLLITFIELIKNTKYQFWNHSFTRCATEIEKVFENVARSCMLPGSVTTGSGD